MKTGMARFVNEASMREKGSIEQRGRREQALADAYGNGLRLRTAKPTPHVMEELLLEATTFFLSCWSFTSKIGRARAEGRSS